MSADHLVVFIPGFTPFARRESPLTGALADQIYSDRRREFVIYDWHHDPPQFRQAASHQNVTALYAAMAAATGVNLLPLDPLQWVFHAIALREQFLRQQRSAKRGGKTLVNEAARLFGRKGAVRSYKRFSIVAYSLGCELLSSGLRAGLETGGCNLHKAFYVAAAVPHDEAPKKAHIPIINIYSPWDVILRVQYRIAVWKRAAGLNGFSNAPSNVKNREYPVGHRGHHRSERTAAWIADMLGEVDTPPPRGTKRSR